MGTHTYWSYPAGHYSLCIFILPSSAARPDLVYAIIWKCCCDTSKHISLDSYQLCKSRYLGTVSDPARSRHVACMLTDSTQSLCCVTELSVSWRRAWPAPGPLKFPVCCLRAPASEFGPGLRPGAAKCYEDAALPGLYYVTDCTHTWSASPGKYRFIISLG